MALRGLALALLFSLASAQGYQVGVYGLGGTSTLYLGLQGVWPWEGGRFTLSLAPYLRLPGGEAGLSVERFSLSLWEGAWGPEVGRFPLTLGVGRLFPIALGRPSPGLGEVGVVGAGLTWYGEAVAVRAGLTLEEGGFLQLRLPSLEAYAHPGGFGLAAEALWEGVVLYGEGRRSWGQVQALLGAAWRVEEVFFALEATYPWGVGLGLEGSLGGLGVGAQVWYRDGFALQLRLSGEGWRAWGGRGPGGWLWGLGVSGDF